MVSLLGEARSRQGLKVADGMAWLCLGYWAGDSALADAQVGESLCGLTG